jgi:hypothetical protein
VDLRSVAAQGVEGAGRARPKVGGLLDGAPHNCIVSRGHLHDARGPHGASIRPPSEPERAEAVLLQGEFRKRSAGRHALCIAPFLPKTGNHVSQRARHPGSPLEWPGVERCCWEERSSVLKHVASKTGLFGALRRPARAPQAPDPPQTSWATSSTCCGCNGPLRATWR